MENQQRKALMDLIARASYQGALGIFAGAGLSIDMMRERKNGILSKDRNPIALSWPLLLRECIDILGLDQNDYSDEKIVGLGYPQVASKICRDLINSEEDTAPQTYPEAALLLKRVISTCVARYQIMDEVTRKDYERWLECIDPQWLITTNYDLLLENVLGSDSLIITPNERYVQTAFQKPICHIHGTGIDPETIVITNEDYYHFFSADDYWQNRLPFLFQENLVLMVGYDIGDNNVSIAIEKGNNTYGTGVIDVFPAIQIKYRRVEEGDLRKEPYDYYTGAGIDVNSNFNGICVIETNDLRTIFQEISDACEYYRVCTQDGAADTEDVERENTSVLGTLTPFSDEQTLEYLKERVLGREPEYSWRNALNGVFSSNQYFNSVLRAYNQPILDDYLISNLASLYSESREDLQFPYYDYTIIYLLGIIEVIPNRYILPTLFHKICQVFSDTSRFLCLKDEGHCRHKGKGQAASDTWTGFLKSDRILECKDFLWRMVFYYAGNGGYEGAFSFIEQSLRYRRDHISGDFAFNDLLSYVELLRSYRDKITNLALASLIRP